MIAVNTSVQWSRYNSETPQAVLGRSGKRGFFGESEFPA